MKRIGLTASEKKLFENVDDGRRIPVYTISSLTGIELKIIDLKKKKRKKLVCMIHNHEIFHTSNS